LEVEQSLACKTLFSLNDFNSLLNPKLLPLDQATMRTYGELCLDNIIDIYGNTDPVIDPVRARRNFLR
jgi:hypothetical protein